jgi:Uma2 family endonuclease
MIQTVVKVGPQDHGRRMSLAEFEPAQVEEGHLYELGRGVVVVSDVPKLKHFRQVDAVRGQFMVFKLAHPDRIYAIAAGSECKILLADLESERHPDLAIYLTEPPRQDDEVWAIWIPDIVVEVVSPGSELRDYVEKREEYFDFGVKEYWIVDADKQEVLVLRRSRGEWVERVLRPGDVYETKLLPDSKFDCRQVFEAAARA